MALHTMYMTFQIVGAIDNERADLLSVSSRQISHLYSPILEPTDRVDDESGESGTSPISVRKRKKIGEATVESRSDFGPIGPRSRPRFGPDLAFLIL